MVSSVFTIEFVRTDEGSERGLSQDASQHPLLRPFVAGPENRLAAVAAESVLHAKTSPYNPLLFYGPSGVGKSHLALGLAQAYNKQHSKSRVLTITAADFARGCAAAAETDGLSEMRARYRDASLLVLDDLGQLSSKTSAQQEFIHVLDDRSRQDRPVIVTASSRPAESGRLLPALVSRLSAGLTVPLVAPSGGVRLVILERIAAEHHVALSASAARILAQMLPLTIPRLRGALLDLATVVGMDGGVIDATHAQHFAAKHSARRQPDIATIASAVAKQFRVKVSDLKGPSRRQMVVIPRGVAMYLARQFTGQSLQQVGRYFGRRDHTTVLHACRKTQRLAQSDDTIQSAIKNLRKLLVGN